MHAVPEASVSNASKAGSWIERYIAAIHWFIPPQHQSEAATLTRAQNVINAVVMAALSGPFYALAYYELGFAAAAQEILLCCLFMFLAPFVLKMSGSILFARELFLCAVFFNFSWLTYHLGGIDAPTTCWLITGPVVAMFLGGVGTALFWLAMSCGVVLFIYALKLHGVELPSHPIKDRDLLFLLCDIGLYIVVVVFVLLFELTKTQGFIKLEQALKIINELAIRDELTGSHNRRHLIKLIENEKERTARLGRLFCLCLLDIDFFKLINDNYGHSAGDAVLREFALAVQGQIRESDSFGRYGGEEFLLMLPQTSLDESVLLAERVRRSIERLNFPGIASDLVVTVSIGVAEFRAGESIAQTVARADQALYQAKLGGRNRVVRFDQQIAAEAAQSPAKNAAIAAGGAPHGNGHGELDAEPVRRDPLTGLLNRGQVRERLTHALDRTARNGRLVALMLLNVNKFKEFNEALGYEVGDEILVRTADCIRNCLRDSDTIARWGGDEFILILEDLGTDGDARQVAEKILEQFAQPIMIGGREYFVTLSIGVALFPAPACDLDALLKRVDIAMMRAKSWGENSVQVYASDPAIRPSERLTLKNGLRQAMPAGELFLEYQPQVELRSRRIVGVEALIRWQHPVYGRVEPARFVPLAEETGMIVPVGYWVLRKACEQSRAWRDAGLAPVKIAVNLSARQLKHPDLVEKIMHIIRETGMDPRYLDLEITEGILIDNLDANHQVLNDLRAAGVQVSIDDFGTGYSSLNYLSELPVDILKMDGSFARRLSAGSGRERSWVVAESIIAMAHRLKLKVIAEAVETAEQLAALHAMQCDEGQGYYFNHPLHPEQVAALLAVQMEAVTPHRDKMPA